MFYNKYNEYHNNNNDGLGNKYTYTYCTGKESQG